MQSLDGGIKIMRRRVRQLTTNITFKVSLMATSPLFVFASSNPTRLRTSGAFSTTNDPFLRLEPANCEAEGSDKERKIPARYNDAGKAFIFRAVALMKLS
jgi:hypothetical protein